MKADQRVQRIVPAIALLHGGDDRFPTAREGVGAEISSGPLLRQSAFGSSRNMIRRDKPPVVSLVADPAAVMPTPATSAVAGVLGLVAPLLR